VVAAFGFYDFTSLGIFVDFHLARLAAAGFGLDGWSTPTRMRIKQADHVWQSVTVLSR
jgi:hypothetical protein